MCARSLPCGSRFQHQKLQLLKPLPILQTRPDKKPEDASSPSYIADLFHRQTRKLDVGPANGKEKAIPVQGGAGPAPEAGGGKEESGEDSGEEEDRPVGRSVGLDD